MCNQAGMLPPPLEGYINFPPPTAYPSQSSPAAPAMPTRSPGHPPAGNHGNQAPVSSTPVMSPGVQTPGVQSHASPADRDVEASIEAMMMDSVESAPRRQPQQQDQPLSRQQHQPVARENYDPTYSSIDDGGMSRYHGDNVFRFPSTHVQGLLGLAGLFGY